MPIIEITTVDNLNNPIGGIEMTLSNVTHHQTDPRYSDGNGYSNHNIIGDVNDLCVITTNGYRITSSDKATVEGPQYYRFTNEADQKIRITVEPFKLPFQPAPRLWKGNMCGVRVNGIAAVPGGASDSTLVVSWLYDRYSPTDRKAIRDTWQAKKYSHVLLSWPDSRFFGQSINQFRATCRELTIAGFYPVVMLASKDFDPHNATDVLAGLTSVLPKLVGVATGICIGWELSLWLSPTDVQTLIDTIAPQFTPSKTPVYVHFQQGYFAFQQPGQFTADFWKLQVGKLTGVLHQRDLSWNPSMYQSRIVDCLQRFAGGYNFPLDSGFGHPFDFVALEITAQSQFNGQMTEAEGDVWGNTAIETPPSGQVKVMGSGNGQS
jgi:hypothetical protein